MNREQLTRALDSAFTAHVTKLFETFSDNGTINKAEMKSFENAVRHAQSAHDDLLARLSDAESGARAESDEDFRARILPIAGNEQRRAEIEAATGTALDAVAQRYRLERGNVAPSLPIGASEPNAPAAPARIGVLDPRAQPLQPAADSAPQDLSSDGVNAKMTGEAAPATDTGQPPNAAVPAAPGTELVEAPQPAPAPAPALQQPSPPSGDH